jgi:hypothetical protein
MYAYLFALCQEIIGIGLEELFLDPLIFPESSSGNSVSKIATLCVQEAMRLR